MITERDRAEFWDDAYLPGRFVPSIQPYLDEYAGRSTRARAELPWRAVRYGSDPGAWLHAFPASRPHAPLVVFVHGGYWQMLTEEDSAFAAREVHAAGAAYAAIGYGLAPRLRLGEIVAQVRSAVLLLRRTARDYRADPARIVLVGHSAGAHLVAMCLVERRLPDGLAARELACAAVLLSGLYELEPVRRSSIGAEVGITEADVERYSPARHLHAGLPPLLLARGAAEPVGFGQQQRLLARGAARYGVPVAQLVVAGRNHFELPLGLADPADPLGRAVLALVRSAARPTPADEGIA